MRRRQKQIKYIVKVEKEDISEADAKVLFYDSIPLTLTMPYFTLRLCSKLILPDKTKEKRLSIIVIYHSFS